jgi:excisionase family DNA binding protein
MNIHDLAKRVGLSVNTVRRAIYRGELSHYRLGKVIRFGKRHVEEWLAKHEKGSIVLQEES